AWALTHTNGRLQFGAEIYHRTADTRGGRPSSGLGAGFSYDISPRYHFIGSSGPGFQNAADTNQYSWYTALLFTT
ncbi:MAG: hypothetical protein ACRES2_11070, partial [Steroidobacteraceae bacterium]